MALGDFFRVNLPYGMKRSQDGKQWVVHNREYAPLGSNEYGRSIPDSSDESTLYSAYKGLTEKKLLAIACEEGVKRNEAGEIIHIWLYKDGTNPAPGDHGTSVEKRRLWDDYCRRLRLLSALQTND